MVIIYQDFDSYGFYYASTPRQAGVTSISAKVTLTNGPNHQTVATIMFVDFSITSGNIYNGAIITLYYPISCFNDFINILRYEKPFMLQFDTSSNQEYIKTSHYEPVGEQEAV